MGITTGLIDGFTEELLFEEELAPKTVHDVLVVLVVLVVLHGVLKYTAAFFPGTFPAVEINNQSRVKKRSGYYLVRSRPDSFLTCWRIWIHASSAFCWRSLQASVSGELCALQWGKISLKEQTIRIDATLQRLRDTSAVGSARTRIVISTPKSDTSVRTIPVTDYTAELCGKIPIVQPLMF